MTNPSRLLKGKQFVVALSHDVDRVYKSFQSFTHSLKHLRKGDLRRAVYQLGSFARPDRYWCFEKIVEIESSYGFRSAFFFLNETYPFRPWNLESWRLSLGYYDIFQPRVSRMIRYLDTEGYEIGLHGSYRSYRDADLLRKEKSDLETILGHPVQGIRQHYLNLSRETWHIQRSLGFVYDSSFGYLDGIGFKEGILHPFPIDGNEDFFVIPQALMDCCLMRLRHPWEHVSELIDFAEANKAMLVLNWHQQIFDEREYPGYCGMYVRILEECLKRKARFVQLGDYLQELRSSGNPVYSGQERQ